MAYALRYHPRVIDQDLRGVGVAIATRITGAIEARLTIAPDRYGEPLSGPLRGFRKMRIGDYRVVFNVVADTVLVVGVWHRRDAYARATRRIGR